MNKDVVYKPKQELTSFLNGLIIDNMRDWKSTTAISVKEWNKLDKELDFCIGQYIKKHYIKKHE
jgi:hypothetical protein